MTAIIIFALLARTYLCGGIRRLHSRTLSPGIGGTARWYTEPGVWAGNDKHPTYYIYYPYNIEMMYGTNILSRYARFRGLGSDSGTMWPNHRLAPWRLLIPTPCTHHLQHRPIQWWPQPPTSQHIIYPHIDPHHQVLHQLCY